MFSILLFLVVAFAVIRADSRILRHEKKTGVNEPPVPRDQLLRPRFRFPKPSFDELSRAFEIGHALSEVIYAGNGQYENGGDYPTEVRHTSCRVLGYIPAYRMLGKPIYKQRAIEGLEYLLRVQNESSGGDFPWYHRSHRGIRNRNDGLFETGIAGRAFVEGYKLTGDDRYLNASRRAAEWEMSCPISPNNNYNMFAVWHLAAHYELTQEQSLLDCAIEKTRLGGMPGQFPSGGWPGHNSWIWYHGIIARGMAELLRVLPQDHTFRSDLTASLTAAINRAIREQTSSGEVPPNPRFKIRGHTCAFILHALLIARESMGTTLDNCIYGIMRYRLGKMSDESFVSEYAARWQEYASAREASREAATGEIVWRAKLDRFVKDAEWGDVAVGAFNCWYPCNDLDPKHVRWQRTNSERIGGYAQQITSSGARLFGGMGWSIPKDVLVPGRRYRFTGWVKCSGGPDRMPLVLCSVYSGRKRPEWDPFSDCEFTRENPTYDSYSPVSVAFTAGNDVTYVYVWAMSDEIAPDESVSLAVDEAYVTDDGLPLPKWDHMLERFEGDPYMILLPTGVYLETMFNKPSR